MRMIDKVKEGRLQDSQIVEKGKLRAHDYEYEKGDSTPCKNLKVHQKLGR